MFQKITFYYFDIAFLFITIYYFQINNQLKQINQIVKIVLKYVFVKKY